MLNRSEPGRCQANKRSVFNGFSHFYEVDSVDMESTARHRICLTRKGVSGGRGGHTPAGVFG